jgi:uncharacterized membrane protein
LRRFAGQISQSLLPGPNTGLATAPYRNARNFGKPNWCSMRLTFLFKRIFQYFLQGLIILAPITITIWTVYSLFTWIDGWLPNILHELFPKLLGLDANGNPRHIPGLGFGLVIVIVLIVGYISSSFIVSRLVDIFDRVLERTPGIKIIYSTIKDFFEAFAGNKRKFDRAILVSTDAAEVWRIGFITREDMQEFGLLDFVAVYVPQSYTFAGHLYFVKKDRIRLLTEISPADAMKFAISGGVTELEES